MFYAPVAVEVWPDVEEHRLEKRSHLVLLGTTKHTVNEVGQNLSQGAE